MPCYLFTYHAHGSWLPDRKRGYVKRNQGIQTADPDLADAYRANMRHPSASFTPDIQSSIIETARTASSHIDTTLHAIASEPTHIHLLVSWQHDREWKSVRTSFRSAFSRRLNTDFGKRPWFATSPSRKRVTTQEHFDYLLLDYLPKHRGQIWRNRKDVAAAQNRKSH